MKISKRELMENEVEVDMPVEWKVKPKRQMSIRYKNKYFELFDIRTGEVHYIYKELEDLVKFTNKYYDYDDEVVD